MTRKLASVLVQHQFIETDAKGRITAGPSPLTHPETGQAVVFSIPAAEWEDGWDWQKAVAAFDGQVESTKNGSKPKPRTRRS